MMKSFFRLLSLFALINGQFFLCANETNGVSATAFDTVSLSERVVPAVVDVYAYNDGSNQVFMQHDMNDLESLLFGDRPRVVSSSGTGCIISEDGVIVTCAHVVKGATKVFVGLNDGRKLEAEILKLGKEMENADVKFLKIKADKLPCLKLADLKTKVRLGEPTLVAGNAFGLGKTSVFCGIISFINRVIDGKVVLQSDVNINVGNSGGPMVNAGGDMIGMAFAIPSKAGGLAFFIPSAMIRYYYDKYLLKKNSPYWGIGAQEMTQDMLEGVGLKDKNIFGVIVTECRKDGPAESVLKCGDVIFEINGQKLATVAELDYFEKTSVIGEEAEVKVVRDGEIKTLKITPAKEPIKKKASKGATTTSNNKLLNGVTLQVDNSSGKLVVVESKQNKFLQEGDVLLALNGKEVGNFEDVQGALEGENENNASVTLRRGNSTITQSFGGGDEAGGGFFSQSIVIG